jgi:hypothetical protein
MPREFQQDGETSFGGFQSFPNSAAFDPQKGILESAINMRIDAGVMRPRMGCVKVSDPVVTSGNTHNSYAASSAGLNDYIHVFTAGGLVKSLKTNDGTYAITAQPTPARSYLKVSGQGYATLAALEAAQTANWSGDYDFTSCCNVVGRMAYAKGDQIWFSLFGGIQPFDSDTLSLTLGTYDEIKKLHYSNVTRKLYAFCDAGIYEIEPAFSAVSATFSKDPQQYLHKVRLLSAQEGIAATDTVGETNGTILWLDNGGINKIDLGKGMVEGELPITIPVHDIFGGRNASQLSGCTAVGLQGRYYIAYPDVGSTSNTNVLVVNTALPAMFESIDRYPFVIKHLVKSRDETGVLRLYAVATDGSIYKLDEGDTDAGTTIQASFRTRDYNFRTDLDKRYDNATVKLDTKGNAVMDIKFTTVNPDSTTVIDKVDGNLGTAVRRALAGKKSIGGKLEVVVYSGRPYFYSVSVDASVAGRSIFSVF